jgi:antitoxin component of MazEF toxin-antitoxin module
MTITSTQTVIKVGDSLAVTIPAKSAKAAGVQAGSRVDISIKPVVTQAPRAAKSLEAEYEAFKAQYGSTLKNLADR